MGQVIALIAAEGEELPAKPVSAPLATDMEDSEGEPPAQSVPSESRVPSPVAARRTELVARANRAALLPDDFAGGTFTISNLGMYGVDAFNAIVNPPQAAILAVARITDRVVAVDGQPAVRPMLTLTLSCDHRAVDGARAAQFLDALAALIEEPLRAL